MRQSSFIWLATLLVVLIGGAVAVYIYDSSRDDLIAEGVSVGGVDLGGLRTGEARARIQERVAAPVERPVVVRFRGRKFQLSAGDARLRADVDGMVADAVAHSRDGNVLTRTFRDLTGRKESEQLSAKVGYSQAALDRLVQRVKKGVDRPARDARLSFGARGPGKIDDEDGVEVQAAGLKRRIRAEIVTPDRDRLVKAPARVTKPKVTREELAAKYPKLIVVNRSGFRLNYYENLKLKRSYTIAVGMAGLETPAGLYNIANKAVNAPWSVPNSPWAGELAGQVIPGGAPNNPLKARWMGIAAGAGIHGTDQTGSLGTAASHGCIRMAIPEVIELYDKVKPGTPVYVA